MEVEEGLGGGGVEGVLGGRWLLLVSFPGRRTSGEKGASFFF